MRIAVEDWKRDRRIEKRLNKLPPDEQAVARLWRVRTKHGYRTSTSLPEEPSRDGKSKLVCTKVMIPTAKK